MDINKEKKIQDDLFIKELESILNKYSKDSDADTPDFILAMFIQGCLNSYIKTVRQKDDWLGHLKKVVL